MTDTHQDYTLPRTGRPSLAFRGEFVAGAYGLDEAAVGKHRPRRWHDLELYRTEGGRYVLSVRYFADWKAEVGHDEAVVCATPAEVAATVVRWDPAAPVAGFPPLDRFRDRQERLLEDVRARFDRCVSDLFAQLGPEFAERIE